MQKKFRNIKTVPKGSNSAKIQSHTNAANLQEKSTLLVPTAPMSFTQIRALVVIAVLNFNLWKNGSKPAKILFKKAMKDLQDGYYNNGVYYETVANDTDNAELFALLGYESYKTVVRKVKASIHVENTSILGVLFFILRAFRGIKCYNIEGTIIDGDVMGTPVMFPILTKSTGTVAGFVSGAKYLIRAQAVFAGGRLGEWTDYFTIRVL